MGQSSPITNSNAFLSGEGGSLGVGGMGGDPFATLTSFISTYGDGGPYTLNSTPDAIVAIRLDGQPLALT